MDTKEKKKRPLDIESILMQIGEFGLYQKLVDMLFCAVTLILSFQILIMYFATLTPTWTCNNSSVACTSRYDGVQPAEQKERCDLPPDSWRYTEERDFSVVTQFNICKEDWLLELLQSITFLGWGIGSIILGWAGEALGRKTLLFPSCGIVLACGIMTVFLKNIYSILALRFVVGFFLPGAMIQTKLLIAEIVGNKTRPLALMIPFFSYALGYSLLSLKSYLLRNWKYLSLICTVPYIFVFAFYSFVVESPKWLDERGRTDEAILSLQKIARWNRTKLDDDIEVSYEIESSHPLSDTIETGTYNTPVLLGVSIQSVIWFTTAMSYFGLQFAAKELQGSLYINFVLLSIVQIPALVVIILGSSKFGRKNTNLIPLVCSSAACLALAFTPKQFVNVRVFLGISGRFFATITNNGMYIWSAELIPTSVRSRGMGLLQFSARVGATCAPWVIKGLTPMGGYIPFVVLGASSLVGAVMGTWLQESKLSYSE